MTIAWMILLFLLGASVGSFLNVVIYRLPRGESIAFPGSHCPRCGRAIRPYDNIPILSWLLLRGKCRFCKLPISIRYPLIELLTAVLVVGLFVAYYLVGVRQGLGMFPETWPTFTAHAILLVALLACSVVDIEMFEVPLEVCWFASLAALALYTIGPNEQVMPAVSHSTSAATVGGLLGLIIAAVLQRRGVLIPSFVDADPRLAEEPELEPQPQKLAKKKGKKGKSKPAQNNAAQKQDSKARRNDGHQVAMTRACGINPRVEILREVLYLLPAGVLAVVAWGLVTRVPVLGGAWGGLWDLAGGRAGSHLDGLFAAAFGYLIGGLWIWGIRILGTLAFGKEAMGLGDVHILAAVGAATGWIIPSIAFFLAPFFGLLWAFWLLARRGQRELPYGPWLALASIVAMLAYDPLKEAFGWYLRVAGIQ